MIPQGRYIDLKKYIPLFLFMLFIAFTSCSETTYHEDDASDWSFVAFGDLRQGFGVYSRLVDNMSNVKPTPQLALCGGDIMATTGNEIEWENFWRYSKPLTNKMPMFVARGNHEGNSPEAEAIFREQTGIITGNLYYAFTHNTACFITLDTEIPDEEASIGPAQFSWLEHELEMASEDENIKYIFINMHRPLYAQGAHFGEDLHNADQLHALFLQHSKIKFILVSHDHIYNRFEKDGITYITSGGAGAPLHHGSGGDFYHFLIVSITEKTNNVNIKTIGLFNEVVEDFNL